MIDLMLQDIKVFSKDNCMKCKMTKNLMDREELDYTEVNINHVNNPDDIISYIKDTLGYSEMPVVEAKSDNGNIVFSGFNPNKIKELKKEVNK